MHPMTREQSHFTKGCFLLLAIGTIPVIFINFTSYIAGLIFIGLLSIALAHILF